MSSRSICLPAAPRILIVRLSAIGDVVQGMPIACTLRDRFPDAFLAWAVGEPGAALLQGHEALDELIALPRRWLKSPAAVWRLRRRLRAMRFDVAIDAQGLTKAALVGRLSGAKRRIGFGDPWGRELSRWLNNELVDTTARHVVDRNLELLRPLGIESPGVRFQVPRHESARLAAEAMIRRAGLEAGFAMINSGAGWPSKLWPNDRYAAVAAYLGSELGLPTLIVWGGDDERAAAEQIVGGAAGHAHLAPPTSLTELAALARRARLFLGSDTGPLHLAAAVATPCIGLFGPWPAERHGPYGPQHAALQEMVFEGSTRQRRNASPKYMEAIGVDLVCRTCRRILRREGWKAA
ncbi:MAG: glycosyltransferase family 9 protein [Pirellulales bacterium]|nr:glycosyltransferase family 9 protein [Pirellulales bacterium]